MQKFLPICDIIFNVVSLALYFCDVVFDVITVYTLYKSENQEWATLALGLILFSLILSQLCSLYWYFTNSKVYENKQANLFLLSLMHILPVGVILRYFKLFTPIELKEVKSNVRDLCLLRLIHAFCEATPMLILQLYLIWMKKDLTEITDLNIVSTSLSLFNLCWALASFNKNIKNEDVHRLVMTWLGVIFQLMWRIGTVVSRVFTLSVYATLYSYWVFLVIGLHWLTMFLWLMSPKNIFHSENLPVFKKIMFSILIAICYTICYINLQDTNSRKKITAFYLVMGFENLLLVSVWLGGLNYSPWHQNFVTATVFISFFIGIGFMVVYYRYFHIKRLNYRHTNSTCNNCLLEINKQKSHNRLPCPHICNELAPDKNKVKKITNLSSASANEQLIISKEVYNVPGVFNCRLNTAIKRKKKKPTSFVPPPISLIAATLANKNKIQQPFWKTSLSSDHESVNSKVDIQQKLLEKKQQQLAELKKIEEEIKVGKLKRPNSPEMSNNLSMNQNNSIPESKKQPWIYSNELDNKVFQNPTFVQKTRAQTPEILLAPHYLENTRIYYEYQDPRWKYGNNFHVNSDELSDSSYKPSNTNEPKKRPRKSHQNFSDLDSQVSIPRSYTLPREFRFHRKNKQNSNKIKIDPYFVSGNSSDGDVDSCDEIERSNNALTSSQHIQRLNAQNYGHNASKSPFKSKRDSPYLTKMSPHETKL